MTLKDYSIIQRALGHIEGVLAAFDDDYGALDCISVIDTILDKEMREGSADDDKFRMDPDSIR